MYRRLVVLLFCALTACVRTASHAAASAPVTRPSTIAPNAAVLWNSGVGSPAGLAQGVVVAQTSSALFGLDAQTGHVLWRRDEALRTLYVGKNGAFAADLDGGVAQFALRSGKIRWRTGSLCPRFRSQRPRDRASFGTLAAGRFYVGCQGGTLVQIDPGSGGIENSRRAFAEIDNFTDVRDAGYGALAVTAWSSGAFIFEHFALLRASTLSPLIPQRTSIDVLGTVGPRLYLFDWCCGIKELADAGSLRKVDLRSGRMSDPVDLTPTPLPSARPTPNNGVGSAARLVGSELFLAAPPMLYDRGPVTALWKHPRVLYSTLVQMVVFLAEGRALVQYTDSNDVLHVDLVDLGKRPPRIERRLSTGAPSTPVAVDGSRLAPGIVAVQLLESDGMLILRASDGRTMNAPCTADGVFSDGRLVVCGTSVSAVLPDLTAYRFP